MSGRSFENGMALSRNSASDNRGRITFDRANTHVDVNPDIIEKIFVDIEPIKILDPNGELETSKDLHEDFENKRYHYVAFT
jgi:hypothetical protein